MTSWQTSGRRVLAVLSVLAVLIFSLIWQHNARASTAGPNLPGLGTGDTTLGTVAWLTPGNVTAVDSSYATVALGKNVVSNYLFASSFGFALPSNAQITGLTAVVTAAETDNTTRAFLEDSSVKLGVASVPSGTEHATLTQIATTDQQYTYGSTSDTWGLTLTGADVDAAGFGVYYSMTNVSSGPGGTETGSVDAVTVTLTYIVPNSSPTAPILTAPSAGATSVSIQPVFTLRTTDTEGDYLRYHIDLYASDCSTVVATIDQPTSQAGWSGQDQQTGTAYTGSSSLVSSTLATYTYQGTLSNATTYCWKASAIDPGGSASFGASSATQSFTTVVPNSPPAAPTLSQPADAASGQTLAPTFKLATTDADSDPAVYSIDLCADLACNSVLSTYSQLVSQSGWSGQDVGGTEFSTSTTLSGSRTATYALSTTLLPGTTYWWRAEAVDPGGSNTWSTYSAISSFTTTAVATMLRGGVTISGGVNFGP